MAKFADQGRRIIEPVPGMLLPAEVPGANGGPASAVGIEFANLVKNLLARSLLGAPEGAASLNSMGTVEEEQLRKRRPEVLALYPGINVSDENIGLFNYYSGDPGMDFALPNTLGTTSDSAVIMHVIQLGNGRVNVISKSLAAQTVRNSGTRFDAPPEPTENRTNGPGTYLTIVSLAPNSWRIFGPYTTEWDVRRLPVLQVQLNSDLAVTAAHHGKELYNSAVNPRRTLTLMPSPRGRVVSVIGDVGYAAGAGASIKFAQDDAHTGSTGAWATTLLRTVEDNLWLISGETD